MRPQTVQNGDYLTFGLCLADQSNINMCDKLILSSNNGYLVSPNFPDGYEDNLSCSCALRSQTASVYLTVAHFSVHTTSPCSDWLDVIDVEMNSTTRLCGREQGNHYTATEFHLTFQTNDRYGQNGFWLFYSGMRFVRYSHIQSPQTTYPW